MAHPVGRTNMAPTTPFGRRGTYWSCLRNSEGGIHTGADWAWSGCYGAPVYAVEAGHVRLRSYGPAFGSKQFALSPDRDGEWFYAHCSAVYHVNEWVEAGTMIGRIGNEGNTTGPHLHLEWKNTKQKWFCGDHKDPWPEIQRLSSNSDYPRPTSNTVYLSKLKFGQKDSDSVWYLQRALGMNEQYWTGYYGPLTDAAVRSCQEKHVPPADPEGKSFVGVVQAEHLFGDTSLKIVNDLPKEDEPEKEPVYPKPTSGEVYLSKLKFGQKDSDSVWYLQDALGMDATTGYYGPMTDDKVRAHQADYFPPADAKGESFVGPSQAAMIFKDSGLTIIDDRATDPSDNPRELNGLKGIDISSHQTGIDLSAVPADFVILKTTEGSSWPAAGSDAEKEYIRQYKQARETGKLIGLYHFARNDTVGSEQDALEEADWFIESVRKLGADNGQTVLVLDWERQPYDQVSWAKVWLDRVYEVLGVSAMIYMNEHTANLTDWSSISKNHPLWLAKYVNSDPPPGYDHSQSAWPRVNKTYWPNDYTIWQYTSRGDLPNYDGFLDLNVSDLTKAEWLELCASSLPIPEPKPDEFFYEVPIITFNMPPRYDTDGVEGDKAMLRELMSQCDILGLQEAAHMLKWIRDLGWNVHRAKNSKGTVLGNYIMSNPEVFEVVDEGSTMISPDTPVIPEGAGPDVHREDHVVWADLRHKATGEIWYIGCVHLVPSKHLGGSTLELWKKQAKATAAWLERQGDIAVVLGDFNCDAGHADANILAKNATIRTDISHGQRAIDWIVVKNHELTSSTSGMALPGRQQSDHKPVLSTVIRTSEEDAALREELEGLKVKVAELEKQFNDFVTASKKKDTATAELLDDLAEHLAED